MHPHVTSQGRFLGTVVLAAGALLVSACGRSAAPTKPVVVATTTILGDVVRQIAGDALQVEVLMPVGADPHDFRASARQAATVARADLVVANGLGLEEGLTDVLASASASAGTLLEIGPLLDPLPLSGARGSAGTSPDHMGDDPHVWLDPVRMIDATGIIARHLAAVDTDLSADEWMRRGEAYASRIRSANETEIVPALAAVPEARRNIVTNHDSLGYFAARYGFRIVGTVVPGGSTLATPSSAELAALVDTIRSTGTTAIFADTSTPVALADAVAAEVGHPVAVVRLYTGSLGPAGSGADTYVGMMVADARLVAGALGGGG